MSSPSISTRRRFERASSAVASNGPRSASGAAPSPTPASPPVVDRLIYNADIIETGATSCRLQTGRCRRPTKENAVA